MASKPPSFQFYVKDWTISTRVLTLQARGLHIDLLAWSWDHGPLPADETKLARYVGESLRVFRAVWQEIADRWVLTERGYVNTRLEDQRHAAETFRDTRAANARARWTKVAVQPASTDYASASAVHGPVQSTTDTSAVLVESSASSSSSASKDQDQKKDPDPPSPPAGGRGERGAGGQRTKLAKIKKSHDYTPEFLEFWSAYPRKVDKPEAFEAWRTLDPSSALRDAIIAALSWQRESPDWTKEGGKYVLYPQRYLNRRRWEDERTQVPVDSTPDKNDTLGVANFKAAARYIQAKNQRPGRPGPDPMRLLDDDNE